MITVPISHQQQLVGVARSAARRYAARGWPDFTAWIQEDPDFFDAVAPYLPPPARNASSGHRGIVVVDRAQSRPARM